jgi:hypothetical protein
MDKDKIFLVVYLNVGATLDSEVENYVKSLTDCLNFDDSVQLFIVPCRGSDTRIECINPVLLDEKQYKSVEKKIKGLKKTVEEKLAAL